MMFFATLPLVLILPVKKYIDALYYNTWFIGFAFLVTGCVLYFSDRLKNGRRTEKNMSVGSAFIVGIAQAIATVPGLSRSGSTISAGIATGMDREFAAKFSFLISIPAVLGANILSLADAIKEGVDTSLLPAYLIGMLVAMVSGYFAVSLVRVICRRGQFGKFAYYCWAVGALTLILSIIL
jgi:undecaprenyl-diphosphatase